MSKAISLKSLKTKLNDTNQVKIKKEKYSWGNHRVISVGSSFSVIIAPEHWLQINNLESGKETTFRDEQREAWRCEFDGKILTFSTLDYSSVVTVTKAELEM